MQVGVVVELAQPRSFVVEIHEPHHVLGVAHLTPRPLDLRLGVEIVVEVLGQDVEQLVVVLGHRLDRHILQTELLHEVEHLLHVGVLVLERRVVDREPHDVVRVHQGDGEVPGLVAAAVFTQPVDRIAGDDRIEEATAPRRTGVVHVVAAEVPIPERLHVRDLVVGEMELAEIRRVVPLPVEERADRRDVRIERRVGRERHIVRHSVLGDIAAGVQRCSARRTRRRVRVIPVEGQAVVHQPLMGGQLEPAAQPVVTAFLVADDEQLVRSSVVPHERRRYEVASISAI